MKDLLNFLKHLFKTKRNIVLMLVQIIIASTAIFGNLHPVGLIISLGIVGASVGVLLYYTYQDYKKQKNSSS